jgi:glycogen debranching enzyme
MQRFWGISLLVAAAALAPAAAQKPAASEHLRGVPAAELARRIRANRDLDQVMASARALFAHQINAGTSYPEVWIRDFATFLDVALDSADHGALKEALRMFFRFQGDDGNIPDGYSPISQPPGRYRQILSRSAPQYWAHKNSVETDQETSLIQSVCTYVRRTGDRAFLAEVVDGKTIEDRMLLALDFLMKHRWYQAHGLLWGATTIDWGDVQPEHPWGTFLTEKTHRSIDVYDNAMLAIALDRLIPLLPAGPARHWRSVRDGIAPAVRRQLWDERRRKFIPHVYLDGSPFPPDFDENAIYFHGGTAQAILAGFLGPEEVEASLAAMRLNAKEDGPFTTVGVVCHPVYPAGYFQNPDHQPHVYINGGDWTWVSGRVVQALIASGFVADAYEELLVIVNRVQQHRGFYEWFDREGKPHGAGQFRGAAGVTGLAIMQLRAWADQHGAAR